MTEPPDLERLKAILYGDGVEVRRQIVRAGLLLMLVERMKVYVTDQVEGFFADEIHLQDGKLNYTRGAKFKQLIKEKGDGEPGQHKNVSFRAALRWFHGFQAITDAELEHVELLYNRRNEIGHELFEIIADDRKTPIGVGDVLRIFHIYLKLVRWWIKEIEVATDPDVDEEKLNSIRFDETESTDTLILRRLINITLGDDPEYQLIMSVAESMEAEATD